MERPDDEGFGLVEIMVSMTLFAILLMALAPVLIQSFATSARNASIAYATQLVNARIDAARAAGANPDATSACVNYRAFLDTPVPDVTDSRGVVMRVTQTPAGSAGVTACPGPLAVQRFTVTVTRVSTGEKLATATTAIAVPGFAR